MKDLNSYNNFDVQQLLEDIDFVNWVKSRDTSNSTFFEAIKRENKELAEKMETASFMLLNFAGNESTLSQKEVRKMWSNIKKNRQKENPFLRRSNYLKILAVAAISLAIIYIGIDRFVLPSDSMNTYLSITQQYTIESSKETQLILPSNQQVTLPDRSEVTIGGDGAIAVCSQHGAKTTLNKTESSFNKYFHLIIPRGKRASVILADGSRVMLKPGSQMVFPGQFHKKKREVYVEGEAFFEVTKNKLKPFIVRTQKMDVEVLGTSFNLSAYPKKQMQSVVLVTGAVQVTSQNRKKVNITPNQRYLFDKTHQKESVSKVDVEDYISWKKDVLTLKSDALTSVLDELSDFYNVSFDYKAVAKANIRLSGKLDLRQNIDEILNVLSLISPIEYKTNNTQIKINLKPKI